METIKHDANNGKWKTITMIDTSCIDQYVIDMANWLWHKAFKRIYNKFGNSLYLAIIV